MRTPLRVLCLLPAFFALESLAHASLIRDASVCTTGAVITGASLFGDGLVVLTGVLEVGGAAIYTAATVNKQDPPDLTNYAIQANNALFTPSTPPITGVDAAFTSAETAYINAVSRMVQDSKNIFDTYDRLAGAKIVGTSQDVANQTLWLSQFNTQLIADFPQYKSSVLTLADYFQLELPAAYNFVPPLATVITLNAQEAAGVFPASEQAAFTAFGMSSNQIGYCETCFQNTTAAALTAQDPLSFGQALRDSVNSTPEPTTILLAGSCLLLLLAAPRYR